MLHKVLQISRFGISPLWLTILGWKLFGAGFRGAMDRSG